MKIDLNSDLGESFGKYKIGMDEEVMKYITSANVACGFHAGDPNVMRRTVNFAKDLGVFVGAHPGFPDLMGFGRRYMDISQEDARNYVLYQIGALGGFLNAFGMKMQHVKPHGALYNAMSRREDLARGVIEGILDYSKDLIFVHISGSKALEIAEEMGAKIAREGFADRGYTKDGTLAPRSIPGGVIKDPEEIARRVIMMAEEGKVETIEGEIIEIDVDTICVHGDNPEAVEILKVLRERLREEGIEVVNMGSFL